MKNHNTRELLKQFINLFCYAAFAYILVQFVTKSTLSYKWFLFAVGAVIIGGGFYYESNRSALERAIEKIVYQGETEAGLNDLLKLRSKDKFRDLHTRIDLYILVALIDLGRYEELEKAAKEIDKNSIKEKRLQLGVQYAFLMIYGQKKDKERTRKAHRKIKEILCSQKELKKLEGLFISAPNVYDAFLEYFEGNDEKAVRILNEINSETLQGREKAAADLLRASLDNREK